MATIKDRLLMFNQQNFKLPFRLNTINLPNSCKNDENAQLFKLKKKTSSTSNLLKSDIVEIQNNKPIIVKRKIKKSSFNDDLESSIKLQSFNKIPRRSVSLNYFIMSGK